MSSKKLQILENIFGEHYASGRSGKIEHLFYCPFCKHHKKKLSININKNCYKCWVCNKSGNNVAKLVYKFGNSDNTIDWNNISGSVDFSSLEEDELDKINSIINLPEEFEPLTSKRVLPSIIQAKKYLFNRGLDREDIIWWKLGYCHSGDYKDRIIVPSFDLDGNVNYFVARTFTRQFPSYKNPPLSKDIIFNELYLDFNEDLIIVEGVFDAIVAKNAIPLLGSTLVEHSSIFETIVSKCSKVFIALDPDAKDKEKHIIDLLNLYGIEVWKINVRKYKDVGSMSKEEFQKRKNNAILVDFNNDLEYAVRAVFE